MQTNHRQQTTLAWVSGLSNPRTCRLPAERIEFMQQIRQPDWRMLPMNFPYQPALDLVAANSGLLAASLHNGRQFAQDSFGWRRRELQANWRPIVESCDQLVIIAISCGMQLLLDAGIDRLANVSLISLGPVGWRRPECPHILVQGDYDYISRLFYRDDVVRIARQGHLNYDRNSETLPAIKDWICNNILK